MKVLLLSLFLPLLIFANEGIQNYQEIMKEKVSQLNEASNNKLDLTKALEYGQKELNFKVPKMKMPTKKIITPTFEERALAANKDKIDLTSKKISEKSENIAKLYAFVATYGIEPREQGDLPGEKEAYLILKNNNKVKLKAVKHIAKK